MKTIIWVVIIMAILAISMSVYLQPNSLALCPYNQGKPSTRQGCTDAEAIVVVSGGDTSARTQKAVDLYKHGWAPKLIFSGAARDKAGPSNAAAMRREAIDQGVPQTAILVEEYSDNTAENASRTAALLRNNNVQDVILVTSGYHQRRASLEFHASTKQDGVVIRNAPTNDQDWGWWWWLTPKGWWLALGETGRIIVFFVTGSAA